MLPPLQLPPRFHSVDVPPAHEIDAAWPTCGARIPTRRPTIAIFDLAKSPRIKEVGVLSGGGSARPAYPPSGSGPDFRRFSASGPCKLSGNRYFVLGYHFRCRPHGATHRQDRSGAAVVRRSVALATLVVALGPAVAHALCVVDFPP